MDTHFSMLSLRPLMPRLLALWRHKGFVFTMVWREFRVRYLRSLLGSIWSVLHPMSMIFVYTVIFSKFMGARLLGADDTMAYGLFLCAGFLTWGYFAELLARCQTVFIGHANLLKKVSFPRTTLPLILLISSTINFAIILAVFLSFLVLTGRFPGWAIVGFMPLLLIQQSFALGLGMLLGTLNVFFRDVGQLMNIVLQFWFWLTPIVYPVAILPERVRQLVELNPMTQFVGAYQQIILYGVWPHWDQFRFHAAGAFVALAAGFFVFRRFSGEIVDEL